MNYYIDCGTHLGEGFKKHVIQHNITPEWKCFTFEANPFTYKVFEEVRNKEIVPDKYAWVKWPNVNFNNKAVWINDGTIDFYCSSVNKWEELLKDNEYNNFLLFHDKLVEDGDLITDHQRQKQATDGSSTIFPEHFKNFLSNNGNSLQKKLIWNNKQTIPCFNFSKWLKETVTESDYVVCKIDIEGAEFDVLDKCIEDDTLKLINVLDVEFHDFNNSNMIQQKQKILFKINKLGIKFNIW